MVTRSLCRLSADCSPQVGPVRVWPGLERATGIGEPCKAAGGPRGPIPAAEGGRVQLSQMIKGTFSERYCDLHGLPKWEFIDSVLMRSLYLRSARLLRPVLRLKPSYFKADLGLIVFVRGSDQTDARLRHGGLRLRQ